MLLRILTLIFIGSILLIAQTNIDLINRSRLAESYENAGDLKKAAELYEELVLLDPSNNLYFESLNRIYVQLKNYSASINLLESAISQKPKDVNLYGLLGSTYYLMGNEEKAVEVWNEPFQSDKINPVFYRVIGNYAVERRAFEIAIDLYEQGKDADEDKVLYAFDLARLYFFLFR